MLIQARNYAGVERADIQATGITIVGGRNAAGKSSLLNGVAAALTGRVLPDDFTKGKASAFVRAGAESGGIRIRGDENATVTVAYPSAERKTTGTPPRVSAFAAGLASVATLEPKERAAALAPYLNAEPSDDDIRTALKDAEIEMEIVDKIVAAVKSAGWDQTHRQSKESGAKLKGRWEQVTGESYGAKKGANWKPAGIGDDVLAAEPGTLAAAVDAARAALEAAIGQKAIDATRLEELRKLAAQIPALEDEVNEAADKVVEANTAIEAAEQARQALPSAPEDAAADPECPHCGKTVVVVAQYRMPYRLEKPKKEKLSADELKQRRLAIADADGKVQNAKSKLSQARQSHDGLRLRLESARKAAAEIEETQGAVVDEAKVAELRAALEAADRNHKACQAATQARALHRVIVQNAAIVEMLAPDGLRKTVLTRALKGFNERLRQDSDAAGWPAVAIEADLSINLGARPYRLCSDSEQWRIRAVLAVAMAGLDGSEIVILDGADKLDGRGRAGLVKMLRGSKVPAALIGMTFDAPAKAPDLAKAGLGSVYWVENGIATPIAEALEKAA